MAQQLPLVAVIKTTIRLPKDLHQRLKIRAVQEGRSLADILVDAAGRYLSESGRTDDGSKHFI
jgi:predicted DNA-binding protein